MTGLQCWDGNGNLILDTTWYVARLVGTISVAQGETGTYTNANLSIGNAGIAFWVWIPSSSVIGAPTVIINQQNGTVSWNATNCSSGTLILGIK
jgi:hypothetical protein